MFFFTFTLTMHNGSSITKTFIANTHADAFKAFCLNPTVQDVSMDELAKIEVTHTIVKEW